MKKEIYIYLKEIVLIFTRVLGLTLIKVSSCLKLVIFVTIDTVIIIIFSSVSKFFHFKSKLCCDS